MCAFTAVLIMLLGTTTIIAADTPMLERTITITLSHEKLEDALKKIAAQGGIVFSYNPSIIDSKRVVSYAFSNKTIREVLDELFDGTIAYKERRKYVILTKASAKQAQIVSGYILDDHTGEKLKNVSVYDPETLNSAVTDDYGYFEIKVKPAKEIILAVNKVNYSDTVVAIPNRRGLLKIPIKNSKEKIVSIADSVRSKIKRFWKTKLLADENMLNISDTLYRKYQVSVVPFIGTNHKLSGNVINDYSFNIYGGYSGGVRMLEIGGTFNLVKGNVRGAQIAGSFNGVSGKVKGFQGAGLINANRDSVIGWQLAGLINLNWNSVQKFSAAGLLNITHRDSRGLILAGLGNATLGMQKGMHVAGLFNFSTKDTRPLQLAGLLNFTAGRMNGAQLGGLINVGVKDMKGVQLGGLMNVAVREIKGVQFSGLVNYGRKVRGAQIGFINIADTVKGVPFGFLSFVLKGYHKVEVSADEIFYTNVAFRTGVHRFYNIFTAGIKPENEKDNFWTIGYGVGTAPKLTRWLSLNLDVTANQVSKGNFTEAINLLNKVYLGFDVRIIKNVSVTFGATLNGYVTDNTYTYASLFTDYKPSIISNRNFNNDVNLKMWWGGKFGLRFF
jgi:hypothetical protein